MEHTLKRYDIEELRRKCDYCGFELTYPEFIFNGNRCVFCNATKQAKMGLIAWIRLAVAEYHVFQKKIDFKAKGMTIQDYIACTQSFGGDIGKIKDSKAMNTLLMELTCQI